MKFLFNRILKHLALKNPLAFKNKGLDQLKKSISVLHYDYLIGTSKELGILCYKNTPIKKMKSITFLIF